ncbi:hypothetical protein [Streptomyces cahuitamycinicus]|uniref:Uncharacterized protein n=1 Tax=Streptomyces cahuitamycinicus TaxID=2070367 RepID=A0A2N8TWU6_9ACTN|nr:hypothetical protein [Streptomyces cahuitamycinicus]PNG23494.1 hypothetical protein C1J00_03740 [Streptomyces cahuitamycinicus]
MAHEYEPPAPDYRLDDFQAATTQIEDDFSSVTLSDDLFVPFSEHHSADGRDSYLLLCTSLCGVNSEGGRAWTIDLYVSSSASLR